MVKDVHRFRCPCCNKRLEFDAKSRKVREVQVEKDGDGSDGAEMDRLLEQQKRDSDRLGDAFEQATRDAAIQADKFDDMFDSALDEAKKDKDEKPPNPFDFD